MTKEKFRCKSCYNNLKKMSENQYYCDQPISVCIDSLRVIFVN